MYRAWKSDDGDVEYEKVDKADSGENTFILRRINCKHPSNSQLQRLLAFVTGLSIYTLLISTHNPCELPRNERQAMYIKKECLSQQSFSNEAISDQLFTIMLSAKSQDVNGKCVRDTRPCPEPAFIVARDRQLNDLV